MLQRAAFSEEELDFRTKQLLKHFSTLDFGGINTLHIFLPILKKHEPDTFLLIDWLKSNMPHIKILVPKADFEKSLMDNYEYLDKESLKINQYNILEPQAGILYHGEIDMVLVPLLAFDSSGNRVGYGKGFYDRFLRGIQTKKIGLSLTDTPVNISDLQANDVALNACITPKGIINFSK